MASRRYWELLKSALFASLLLIASGIASASVVTFNLSGTLTDGSALGGFLNIDTTAGLVTTANVTLGPPDSLLLTVIRFDGLNGSYWEVGVSNTPIGTPFQSLFFPVASLVGYTGGPFCTLGYDFCGAALSTFIGPDFVDSYLTSGSATAVPEPSTISIVFVALAIPALFRREMVVGPR